MSGAYPLAAFGAGAAATTASTAAAVPEKNSRYLTFAGTYRASNAVAGPPTLSSTSLTFNALTPEVHSSTSNTPDLYTKSWLSNDTGSIVSSSTHTVGSSGTIVGCWLNGFPIPTDEITGNVVQWGAGEDLSAGDPTCLFAAVPSWLNPTFINTFHGGGNSITWPTQLSQVASNVFVTARQYATGFAWGQPPIPASNQVTSTNVRSVILGIELEANLTAPAAPGMVWFNSVGASGTITTSSLTKPASTPRCWLLVTVRASRNAALATEPDISNTGGLTFTKLNTVHTPDTTTSDMWLTQWIADIGASPPSGFTITSTSTNASGMSMEVVAIAYTTTDGTARQTATGTDIVNGDPAYSWGSAPSTSCLQIVHAFYSGSSGMSNPPGTDIWRRLAPSSWTPQTNHQAVTTYSKGNAAQSATFGSFNTRGVLIALELNPPSAATPKSLPPGLMRSRPILPLTRWYRRAAHVYRSRLHAAIQRWGRHDAMRPVRGRGVGKQDLPAA